MDGTEVLSAEAGRKIIQYADILLVQPDSDTACNWRDSLLDFGMTRVRVAGSRAAALEAAQFMQPAGIVIALPILADAFALMGALTLDSAGGVRDIPMLLVAHQPSRATMLTATNAGFDAVLAAPVSPRQIYRRVASMIQRARSSARLRMVVN